ncbi:hypothetical protein CAEBREN_19521 [Caenorhabditis brenneri]|uniref:DUF38 domain-containing protein n=1 Tax=Caenorhabditis brenneri TaxID=135651 RepID=G0N8A2_CAEBE|nr:hypothetical protein CAEBREN_19521 [Caenorhabditis brenneri]
MPAFKKDLLDGIVYASHFDGLPATMAHLKLRVMTGQDTYTLEDVEKLYGKIERGEFSLMEEIDWVNKFPPHLSKNVVEMLDVPARASLRKTCHFYRNLVDTGSVSIEQLVIIVEHTGIEISSEDKFYLKYEQEPENQYTVSQYHARRRRFDGNFITAAVTDLKTIIGNSKLMIRELGVNKRGSCDETQNAVQEVFKSLKHKLKVGFLELDSVSSIQKVLPYVDENTIQTIVTTGEPSEIYLPGKEIFDLPQWKNAKTLKALDCEFNPKDFVELSHFENVKMSMKDRTVTVEQVMALKDKLLENPKLQAIHIYHIWNDWSEGVFEALDTALLQFKFSPVSRYAHFDYPGTGKKLGLRITKSYIRFRGPCCLESEDANYLGDETGGNFVRI